MKGASLLFIPGGWLVHTLPIVVLIDAGEIGALRIVGLFILLSYFSAAPGAFLCSAFGAISAIGNWESGTRLKVYFLVHVALLALGGFLSYFILTFPRIGPH